jgi:uncharacterized small protein (DUF1192 family)
VFDDDRPKPKTNEFPKNMVNMSIEELEAYIGDLNTEIERARADIAKKKASLDAAASIFKS